LWSILLVVVAIVAVVVAVAVVIGVVTVVAFFDKKILDERAFKFEVKGLEVFTCEQRAFKVEVAL